MSERMVVPSPVKTFSLNPLMWLAGAFAAGIAFAEVVDVAAVGAAVVALVAGSAAVILRDRSVFRWLCIGALAAAGAFSNSVEITSVSHDRIKFLYDTGVIVSGDPVEIFGTLGGPIDPMREGVSFTIDAERIIYKQTERPALGTVKVFLRHPSTGDAVELPPTGSTVAVVCNAERDEQYLNPGVVSRLVLLDQQGIDVRCSVKSPLLIETLSVPAWRGPVDHAYQLRRRMIAEFTLRYTPETAGVLAAANLGNKQFLDRETASAFREGGVFHILVISGLHITFIGGLILWIVRRVTRRRMVQFTLAAVSLWIFVIAVGANPPAVRAGLMMTLLLIGFVFYRRAHVLNVLGASVLLLLMWNPADLFNPSFQLTVTTVGGIIALGMPLITKLRSIGEWTPSAGQPFPPLVPTWLRRCCETLYWRDTKWAIESRGNIWSANLFKKPYLALAEMPVLQRSLIFVFEGAVISLVAQMAMLPLGVYLFHRLAFGSIVLNLWIGGFMAVAGIASVLAFAFTQVSEWAALPFVGITEAATQAMVFVPKLFAGWSTGGRMPVYSGAGKAIYLLYYVPFVAATAAVYLWAPFERRLRSVWLRPLVGASVVAVVVLSSVMIIAPFTAPAATGKLRIDFLDVGQGDSILVTFPNGETMLIDGGGRMNFGADEDPDFEPDIPRIGETVVSEFLWEKGYRRIDHIVATHADTDHIQGLVDVARNFEIGRAYLPVSPDEDRDLDELWDALVRQNAEIVQGMWFEQVEIGGARVEFLETNRNGSNAVSENDLSIVLRITYGSRSMLFTGDIEERGEAVLLAANADLAVDVVKVAHHGSRTSSMPEFVERTRPIYAVIPVGRKSMFGHPHGEVVDRWVAAGARVLTTGERGTVTIETDGSEIWASDFLSVQ